LSPHLRCQSASKKVTIEYKSALTSATLKGKFTSKPFGKGTLAGKANLPLFTITFKPKGGTFLLVLKGAPSGEKIKATWTISKGTGKYKKIKGKGKGTGTTDGDFKLTGTASY